MNKETLELMKQFDETNELTGKVPRTSNKLYNTVIIEIEAESIFASLYNNITQDMKYNIPLDIAKAKVNAINMIRTRVLNNHVVIEMIDEPTGCALVLGNSYTEEDIMSTINPRK